MNQLTFKLFTHALKAKELALKAKDYAKENPDTVLLGLTSLLLLDISDSSTISKTSQLSKPTLTSKITDTNHEKEIIRTTHR